MLPHPHTVCGRRRLRLLDNYLVNRAQTVPYVTADDAATSVCSENNLFSGRAGTIHSVLNAQSFDTQVSLESYKWL